MRGHWRSRSAVVACSLALLAAVTGSCSDSSDDAGTPGTTVQSAGGEASDQSGGKLASVLSPEASTVAEVLALGRPIVLAHAAGENVHPHSTPWGYDQSARAGVDVLDFDVQLSSDGVLVVQHDLTVDRTTDGSGDVASMTFDELSALDNAYWFTTTCACRDQPESDYTLRGIRTGDRPPPEGYGPDDFSIPRFRDIAERYPDYVLNIEIKGEGSAGAASAKELAGILAELDATDRAVVTSFDDTVVEAFAAEAPGVVITPGLQETTAYVLNGTLPASGRTILQVPPDFDGLKVLTPELVTRTSVDGLVLWIWPNEQKWENTAGYTELLDLGVEGLNAADPATAVAAVRAWVSAR